MTAMSGSALEPCLNGHAQCRMCDMFADARHFFPISERLVAATRVQMGNIHPAGFDPTEVPFSKKYFLGGASSLRGWGRFEVSPLISGLPIGGNTLFAFSTEGRLGLRGKLGGVLFLDGGNVWTDSRDVKFAESSLRRRHRPALRDTGRSDSPGFRLSAESGRRAPHRWIAAVAPVARSFQHRPGVLEPSSPSYVASAFTRTSKAGGAMLTSVPAYAKAPSRLAELLSGREGASRIADVSVSDLHKVAPCDSSVS